jgi:apolipoprotein N-acyltransferase
MKIEETVAGDGVSSREHKILKRFMEIAPELLHWLEIILACCAVVVVLFGAVCLCRVFLATGFPHELAEYTEMFEDILSALLLLVVGVELAIMLCLRRPESLIEIMFFVIARKVLIKTHHVYELVIAVVAMGALFAIDKYLVPEKLIGGRNIDDLE